MHIPEHPFLRAELIAMKEGMYEACFIEPATMALKYIKEAKSPKEPILNIQNLIQSGHKFEMINEFRHCVEFITIFKLLNEKEEHEVS